MNGNETDKKILLISPFFYPELISTGKYNTYLAKEISKRNIFIQVVASYPIYPDWRPVFTEKYLPNMKIYRGGISIKYPNSAVARRLLLEIWFALYSLKTVWKLRKNTGLVIAIFPPTFFMLAISVVLPKNIPKMGIVHDIQGVMAESTKKVSRRIIGKIIGSLEAVVYRSCDKIVCLSESMFDYMTNKCRVPINRCLVHYPFVAMNNVVASQDLLAKIMPENFVHIVYSGALGEKQKPLELLKFFQTLVVDNPCVMCHIFSKGSSFEKLKNLNNKKHNNKIRFHDLVSEDQLTYLYEHSDIQIIPQAEDTSIGAFPSKLPNLLSEGVPIFAICDENSELSKILLDVRFCKVMHTWDNVTLVKGMNQFIDKIKEFSREETKEQSKEYVLSKFNVDNLVSDILRLKST